MPVGGVGLLAHRGGSLRGPENTLEALRRAKEDGADGIEFDVRLSSDREPFLFHDEDGLRVSGVRGRVSAMPWRRVRDLRAFGEHKIPHLADLLSAMEGWPGADLYLDLHQDSIPLAETVARAVMASPVRDRCFVLAFYWDRKLLAAAASAAPGVRLAVMPGPPWWTDAACGLGAAAICLGWDGNLTRWLYRAGSRFYDVGSAVRRAAARGVKTSAGVANTQGQARFLADQGVSAVWTDDVPMARRALERQPG